MTALFDMGAIIAPVVPAFYNKPATVDDIVQAFCEYPGSVAGSYGVPQGHLFEGK